MKDVQHLHAFWGGDHRLDDDLLPVGNKNSFNQGEVFTSLFDLDIENCLISEGL